MNANIKPDFGYPDPFDFLRRSEDSFLRVPIKFLSIFGFDFRLPVKTIDSEYRTTKCTTICYECSTHIYVTRNISVKAPQKTHLKRINIRISYTLTL